MSLIPSFICRLVTVDRSSNFLTNSLLLPPAALSNTLNLFARNLVMLI